MCSRANYGLVWDLNPGVFLGKVLLVCIQERGSGAA